MLSFYSMLGNMKSFFIVSSVGRKVTIGLTGVGLAIFVLTHMLGNLLLFVSPQAYNQYSHTLITNPLIIPMELGLVALFLIHAIWAIALAIYNKKAKGSFSTPKTSLIHKTLWAQGVVIFIFVISHLRTFKYGPSYTVKYWIQGQNVVMRDLFSLVAEIFQQPFYTAWYIFCMIILFTHLNHGLQASIRSLGFHHDQFTLWIKRIGTIYASLVSFGFISQVLYFFFFYKGVS